MTPAIAEWARLVRFLKNKKFRPFSHGWMKYNIIVEKGSGECLYNVYRGTDGAAYWDISAEKVKELLGAT